MLSLAHRTRARVPHRIPSRFFSEAVQPKKTALYDVHLQLGGKMVPFAGYSLPVQYTDGVVDNHLWVRSKAGIFDVSHMGQLRLTGQNVEQFIETITVIDMQALQTGQAGLSLITNEKGGIIDDCIVTKGDGYIGLVVNGACKEKDIAHMRDIIARRFPGLNLSYFEDKGLVALQGPSAAPTLQKLLPNVDVPKWPFMFERQGLTLSGIPCNVTRCGYTGEDGFEISVEPQQAPKLFSLLLEQPDVRPSGLAVRDSLRLEAGLCLYGHDLNEDTNPIEASLAWTICDRFFSVFRLIVVWSYFCSGAPPERRRFPWRQSRSRCA